LLGEVVAFDEDAVAEAFEGGVGVVEAVGLRERGVADVAAAAHVPFAEVAGRVAGMLEGAGDAGGVGVEPVAHAEIGVGLARGEEGVDEVAGGILAGGDGDAGGRADGRGDVELGEEGALRGEAIDVGGGDVAVAGDAEVAEAEVVDEDEEDVGAAGGLGRRGGGRGGSGEGGGEEAAAGEHRDHRSAGGRVGDALGWCEDKVMPTWGAEWMATLVDERTKRTRQTMVSPTVDGLDVRTEEGEWRQWPWARVTQGVGSKSEVELRCDGESVRVADWTMIDSIHRIAPVTRGRLKSQAGKKLGQIAGLYVGAAVVGVAAAWLAIGWAGAWAVAAAPRSWEKKIGEAAIGQFAPSEKVCGDRDVYLAMQTVAGRLRATVPAEAGAFDIRVVDDPLVNAVTLPGGYIVVYRGLLRASDTPEELAGVLAHEMQHAVQRHSMKALGREAALWSVVAWVTGGADVGVGQLAGELAGLKMQREDELAADAGALEMLLAAQIDAGGFESFFEKLGRQEGSVPWLGQAVSTHPESQERLRRIRRWREARDYAAKPLLDGERWREVRVRCR